MKKIITIFFLTFMPLNAYAAISEQEQNNAISNQNIVIQRDQQIENEKIKEKDVRQIEKERKEIEDQEEDYEELKEQEGKVIQDLRVLQCFRINKIIFSESKIISKADEEILVQEYLGKCLSRRQIAKLSKKISDYLIDDGYVTSRVEIPPQNLSAGTLQINIIESYLEKITFNNDEKFSDKTQKFMAFGTVKKNKILNLRKIEQGLDQVNRLPSNNAKMKIIPGTQENYSIVAVENNYNRRTRLNASYDNNGNKITGSERETIGFSHDNLLWLNDSLTINRTANDLEATRKKNGGTNSASGSFSVPYKWYNLTLSYSKSSYFFWSGNITRFKSSGETMTRTVSLDRLLIRSKKGKFSANFTLVNRYNQNFIEDRKIEVSSRKASIASLSFPSSFFLENSNLFLKPTYSRTLNILDAKQDSANVNRRSPHAEFDIFKFYGNYTKKSQIFTTPVSYNTSFDSQFSRQKLYGIDRFSTGGIYSTRGFQNGTISGDSGYNLKTELTVNLGQLILPHIDAEKMQFLTHLNRFYIMPFYDYGHVTSKADGTSGRLTDAGIKIGFSHQNLNASLTFSHALSKSHLLMQNYKESNAVFFNISSEVGF